MRKRNWLFPLTVGSLLTGLWLRNQSQSKLKARLEKLYDGSVIKQTAYGPIEFAVCGEGAPVLVLHGLMGDYEHGTNYALPLTERGYRIIAPSRPGYLRTPASPGQTAQEQAALIASLLDEIGMEDIPVIAVSGGGPVGLALAEHHPDKCRSLVLINAITHQLEPFRFVIIWAFEQFLARVPKLDPLAWLITESMVKTLPMWTVFMPNLRQQLMADDDKRQLYEDAIRAFFPAQHTVSGFSNDTSMIDALNGTVAEVIHQPILTVHSATSMIVPRTHADQINKRFEQTEQFFLQDAGHAMHLTHADKVWNRVVDFIEKHYERKEATA